MNTVAFHLDRHCPLPSLAVPCEGRPRRTLPDALAQNRGYPRETIAEEPQP
jgi:hypothetical protein